MENQLIVLIKGVSADEIRTCCDDITTYLYGERGLSKENITTLLDVNES